MVGLRLRHRGHARHDPPARACLPALPAPGQYAAVVLAVGHRQFVELGAPGIQALGQPGAVLFDVKGILPLGAADARL